MTATASGVVAEAGRLDRAVDAPVPPALEVRGLVKRYGSVVALDGLDLSVGKGELVSLLGPSGCGKTTTLQVIAGFARADAGEVLLKGERVDQLPTHRRNIGVVFQDHALFPHMSVAGNVGFGLRMRRRPKAEVRERVSAALDLVQLSDKAGRYPDELSGGQQQRVALARAIVIEPDLLLLDEPLSSLDRRLRESLRWEIDRIHRSTRMTTVFVTHDQEEAMALSDRIVVMDQGQALQQGPPRELYERPGDEFVADFLGSSNLLPGVVQRRDDDGWVHVVVPGLGTTRARASDDAIALLDSVVLALRPQDLRLRAGPERGRRSAGEGTACGRVTGVEFIGVGVNFMVSVGPLQLRVTSYDRAHATVAVEDEVELVWPEQFARVLPASPGEAR